MRAVTSLSAQVNEAATADAVLGVVVRGVREALDGDVSFLFLLDESGDTLRIAASAGLADELASSVRVPVGRGVTGRIAETRRPEIVVDVAEADIVSPELHAVARSLVGVPLIGEGRVLGVLVTASRATRTFTPEDVTLLELLGARAASALLRARLYDDERVAREQAERLQKLSQKLTRVLTRLEVTETVVRHVVEALGAYAGGVIELSDDGREFVLLGAEGYDDSVWERYGRFSVDIPYPVGDVARRRTAVFITSRAEWDARYAGEPMLPPGATDGAWAALPLIVEDRLLGALTVSLATPRDFSKRERRFAWAFADLCAQALDRARLYDAERTGRSRAEALQQLTAALAATTSTDDIGHLFSSEVAALLGADTVWVGAISADGAALEARGWRGFDAASADRWRRLPLDAQVAVTDAVRSGRAGWWESKEALAAAYPQRAEIIRSTDQEAVAIAPLIGDAARPIGAMAVGYRSVQRFDDDTRAFMLALAQQCAQALARVRAFEAEREAQRRADAARVRAEQLQALTASLARSLTAPEVAEAAVAEAGRAVGALTGLIALLDEDGSHFTLLPGPGMPNDLVELWRRFPNAGMGPASTAVRTLEPCYSPTRADFLARNPAFVSIVERLPLEADVALPLVVDAGTPSQRVFGALTFSFAEPRSFSSEDDAFLRASADQCAQALDRARLFAAERRARAEAEAAHERAERLRALAAALGAARTPDEVGATIVREGLRTLGARQAGVGLLEDEGRRFRFIQLEGATPNAATTWATFPNVRTIPYGEVAATRRVLCLPSHAVFAERFPDVARTIDPNAFEALVVLPLIGSDGVVLGAAHFAFADRHEFGGVEVRELEDLAQESAQALERARLFEAERAARTDAEAARAAAEAANRAKMDFLATMSHELRTPLNAIGGYADLLALGIRGPITPQQLEDLARIQKSQQHLLGLINEVLNFARLESGMVRYDIADLGVAALLGGLEALVLPQVRAKGLSLTLEPCDPALRVLADAEKLRQILLNLLSNAIKFTPPGGKIHVGARAVGNAGAMSRAAVAITVRDTGVGIPAEQLDAVFEPFVQVGRTLNNPSEGTGLGLAISRDLARGMGGELTATSVPDEGSSFTLTLPRLSGE